MGAHEEGSMCKKFSPGRGHAEVMIDTMMISTMLIPHIRYICGQAQDFDLARDMLKS